MPFLSGIAVGLSVIGLAYSAAGWWQVKRFATLLRSPAAQEAAWPPVSVLKPLHDDEPLLEQALSSFCTQDYPCFQLVCGVQDPKDPAALVVERLQHRFPAQDITLVVNPARHGTNGKVSNLINMLSSARYDYLVISDADIHAPPDYLRKVITALRAPGVELVTTLYGALPANPSLAARLGALHIVCGFLPSALIGRQLGREDCFGATMALRRETLQAVGGFEVLADRLADDAVLGRLIRAKGGHVALAASLPATTVSEARIAALLRHELRWARTIRSLAPFGFLFSILQYPIVWAMIALISKAALPNVLLLLCVWLARSYLAKDELRLLAQRSLPLISLLLPLREALSFAIVIASWFGNTVDWRGRSIIVDRPPNPKAGISALDKSAKAKGALGVKQTVGIER
ncbi:MAG: bacteriohopanetetrol glucosamine biosynthesis glycosyltransferase HpnI [Acidobacteriia bacterium]|nr:bacteriohopanetetrol glucosamine biosynthesis glycosyltransferase HpnI [Methyloceanibacter sp.]MCL6491025.1 bacteriohopanetetrol glucosamine biosynthesis glycosyltransferase HpnI [Terriglobia bacterium]